MKVILASGSPRRRELMEMLGIRCKVQASGAEEVVTSAEPEKVVEELSRGCRCDRGGYGCGF